MRRPGEGRRFPYCRIALPLPTLGSVMVGTGSPSKLGITYNNSHAKNEIIGMFLSSSSSGSLTRGSKPTRVIAPVIALGIAAMRRRRNHGVNAQMALMLGTAWRTVRRERAHFARGTIHTAGEGEWAGPPAQPPFRMPERSAPRVWLAGRLEMQERQTARHLGNRGLQRFNYSRCARGLMGLIDWPRSRRLEMKHVA